MQEYEKHIARWMLSTVWVVSARKKNICLYPETVLRNKSSFEESLRRGKIVKNLDVFWMNNETIIELGFRLMWICRSRKLFYTLVDKILLDLHNFLYRI